MLLALTRVVLVAVAVQAAMIAVVSIDVVGLVGIRVGAVAIDI